MGMGMEKEIEMKTGMEVEVEVEVEMEMEMGMVILTDVNMLTFSVPYLKWTWKRIRKRNGCGMDMELEMDTETRIEVEMDMLTFPGIFRGTTDVRTLYGSSDVRYARPKFLSALVFRFFFFFPGHAGRVALGPPSAPQLRGSVRGGCGFGLPWLCPPVVRRRAVAAGMIVSRLLFSSSGVCLG